MNKTRIPWTRGDDGSPGYTWNVVTGCTPISQGCEHCYAQAMAKRFGWPQGVTLRHQRLGEPLGHAKPSRIFVCSMSDLFHDDVPDEFLARVFAVFATIGMERHTFQILTKRPARMLRFVHTLPYWPLPNVWLGVTAENQARFDERWGYLAHTPAAIRFVSYEPALGPLDLAEEFGLYEYDEGKWALKVGSRWAGSPDWVIAGCESGPGRRPAEGNWFRTIRDQCIAAGVPFFYKQCEDPMTGKVISEPYLDSRQWLQFPEVANG